MHLNVRSLLAKNKFDLLKAQMIGCNMSVITISESWLNPKILPAMVKIPGYSIAREDRPNTIKSREGGLITYIADYLAFDNSQFRYINHMSKDLELQCLSLDLGNVRQIIILNVYRPPPPPPTRDQFLFFLMILTKLLVN